MKRLSAFALNGIPEIFPGDDLADILLNALRASGEELRPHDIVVVAQKIVSKAEGRVRTLDDFVPSPQALDLAKRTGKDARKIEAILSESTEVLRAINLPPDGLIVARHRHGWICANAAIDESNVGSNRTKGAIVLLPEDPDRSARHLRDAAEAVHPAPIGVLVSDTFGRPWRQGLVNVAIGTAGVPMVDDWVGRADLYGRPLEVTQPAFADEVATTAGRLMTKDGGTPFVVVRGLDWTPSPGARARDILRPIEKELFR